MKTCTKCGIEKLESEFCAAYSSCGKDFLQSHCMECKRIAQREYRATPEGKRAAKSSTLKYLYGITIEDYERMYTEQHGLCDCCGEWFPVLCVEHNHTTGVIRGLTCRACNFTIETVENDGSRVLSAALYVKRHS
jgi:hypothetical protein